MSQNKNKNLVYLYNVWKDSTLGYSKIKKLIPTLKLIFVRTLGKLTANQN